MLFKSAVVAAAVGTAVAQRPVNTTICDYYTTALLVNNTAANQMTLLTLVVNTAVIGNYTVPNVGISVPGILAEGEVNGTKVNLLPYFSGGLASTNTGGMAGRSVNFLDGGGAEPLKKNMPADSEDSRQYRLLTHLYEYFGTLLGCSMQGGDAFPAYAGETSQYEVHKFMGLSNAEVTYFIQQVGASAKSFGVTEDDVGAVAKSLQSAFGLRCAPEVSIPPTAPAALQAICIDETCPISPNATCDSYNAVVEPSVANGTSGDNSTGGGSSSASPSSSATGTGSETSGGASPTGSSPAEQSGNSAAVMGMSFAAVAGGIAAMFL